MPTSQGIEGYRESTSAVMMWVPGGSVPVGRLLRNDVVSLEEPGILSSSGHVIEVGKLSIRYKGLLYGVLLELGNVGFEIFDMLKHHFTQDDALKILNFDARNSVTLILLLFIRA